MNSKATAMQARLRLAAAASAALALSLAASVPARAADDGQGTILGSMMRMVGLDEKPETAAPKIDYRQRPSLVLPKSLDLPPPARAADARNPAWPKDPDVMAQRREEALARAPASQAEPDGPMDVREMQKDRTPASAKADYDNCEFSEKECDPRTIWSQLKIKKGDPGAIPEEAGLVPGKEPPRKYLTQPPPGYMTPKRVVKRTWEQPGNKNSDDNPNVYFQHQAGHNVTEDDPSDN